ncbi:hypothetical protein SAMN05421736_101847 [Evansella caseinilytica]|uniref:Uncharacterized protein n=1 Tax=Evansella caseinilytica TaxID=1503961 RepID=A0A1H3IJW5_9BACI|nr:hypothetical protein SAMN05421736_101847 [Evansella caseinilytica]
MLKSVFKKIKTDPFEQTLNIISTEVRAMLLTRPGLFFKAEGCLLKTLLLFCRLLWK